MSTTILPAGFFNKNEVRFLLDAAALMGEGIHEDLHPSLFAILTSTMQKLQLATPVAGLPGLEVSHGSSGIEIRVKLSQKFNCGEFTLNDNAQPVFISPWIQFEPSAMSDERQRIANEIARRALVHDHLIAAIDNGQKLVRAGHDHADAQLDRIHATWKMWGEERAKFGLSETFEDKKGLPDSAWPRPMMSQFRYTDAVIMRKALEDLLAITETLCNGLEWNIENHPTVMNQSDEEALAAAREKVTMVEAVLAGNFKGRE